MASAKQQRVATHEVPNTLGGLFDVAIIADDGSEQVEVQVVMRNSFNGWSFMARRDELRLLKRSMGGR